MSTPKTWGENATPTPEQFALWFMTCPRDEQIEVAASLLEAGRRAALCFIQNHKALAREVEQMRADYSRGFEDACRLITKAMEEDA